MLFRSACFVLAGCSPPTTVKIRSNPDNVDIVCQVYAVTDRKLSAIDFKRFMSSEQVGQDTLQSDPQTLQGYQNLSNAIALVVERKIQDGAKLKTKDFGATLRGIEKVPTEYETDLRNNRYIPNAHAFDFGIRAQLFDPKGNAIETTVGKGGAMKFIWFLLNENRTCELVVGSAKPLTLEIMKKE